MESNFDFLQQDFPVLANFGRLSERYCYSDPNSSLIKLGMMGETIVNLIFTYDKIPLPNDNAANVRINVLLRDGFIDSELASIFCVRPEIKQHMTIMLLRVTPVF